MKNILKTKQIILYRSSFLSAIDHSTILPNLTTITSQDSNIPHFHHCRSKLAPPNERILSILQHLCSRLWVHQRLVRGEQTSIRRHASVVLHVSNGRGGVHCHHQACAPILRTLPPELARERGIQTRVRARVRAEVVEAVAERRAVGPPQCVRPCVHFVKSYISSFTSLSMIF